MMLDRSLLAEALLQSAAPFRSLHGTWRRSDHCLSHLVYLVVGECEVERHRNRRHVPRGLRKELDPIALRVQEVHRPRPTVVCRIETRNLERNKLGMNATEFRERHDPKRDLVDRGRTLWGTSGDQHDLVMLV